MKFDGKTKIYIYQKPIDMRLGFERLSYLVREDLGHNIDVGDLFLFLGNNRRRIKGLRFDGSGLILFTKRMEKKRGFMNVLELSGRIEISHKELELLLHGSVLIKHLPMGRKPIENKPYDSSMYCEATTDC